MQRRSYSLEQRLPATAQALVLKALLVLRYLRRRAVIGRFVTSKTPGGHVLGQVLAQTGHVRAESAPARGAVFVTDCGSVMHKRCLSAIVRPLVVGWRCFRA